MRSQVHIEYLILVGFGLLLSLLAVGGVFVVFKAASQDLNDINTVENNVIGALI